MRSKKSFYMGGILARCINALRRECHMTTNRVSFRVWYADNQLLTSRTSFTTAQEIAFAYNGKVVFDPQENSLLKPLISICAPVKRKPVRLDEPIYMDKSVEFLRQPIDKKPRFQH